MAVRLIIEGIVQGVGYRAWMESQARSRNIRGWVRNLTDGSVEAWLEGDRDRVLELVQAARQGPRFASVNEVTEVEEPDQRLRGFEVRPTVDPG